MDSSSRRDLLHDLYLPTLFLVAVGAMVWAVRGCSGFGAMKGCMFAGVTWGAAWWYLAHDPSGKQSRRYASAWIILALTVGIGLSGGRGWMQWPSFFRGELMTDAPRGEFVPIARAYGFLWLFLAGMPWAGIGACLLAWTGAQRPMRAWEWFVRIGSGFVMAYLLGTILFSRFPEIFLPLYSSIKDRYLDVRMNPNLQRLVNDNRAAMTHMGFYLGFLLFEVVRREWRNVKLILAVGVLAGVGWALFQNWQWALKLWPGSNFNFWRCWESSGGISIGFAYGIAFYVVNRPMSDGEKLLESRQLANRRPNLEWLFAAGLMLLLAVAMVVGPGPSGPGMGRGFARPGSATDTNLYLIAGIFYAVACTAYYFVTRAMSGEEKARRKVLFNAVEWVGGLGLMLVFGWFIKSWIGMRGGGGRGASGEGESISLMSRLSNWGGDYFYIAMAYGVIAAVIGIIWYLKTHGSASEGRDIIELEPNLGWLAVYLALGTVAAAFIGSEFRNTWNYHFWIVLVAALFAVIYYLMTRRATEAEAARAGSEPPYADPNLERWGLAVGLLVGLGQSLRNGFRGWANIYLGNEDYWTGVGWNWIGGFVLLGLAVSGALILIRRHPRQSPDDPTPYAYRIIWLVLILQNIIAQAITGPVTKWEWREQIFSVYYLVLFVITALIVHNYHSLRAHRSSVKAV